MSADVARRIQRAHNRFLPAGAIVKRGVILMFTPAGGFLGVHRDGQEPWPPGSIPFVMREGAVSRAEVAAYLDALAGVQRSSLDLYGHLHRKPVEEVVR